MNPLRIALVLSCPPLAVPQNLSQGLKALSASEVVRFLLHCPARILPSSWASPLGPSAYLPAGSKSASELDSRRSKDGSADKGDEDHWPRLDASEMEPIRAGIRAGRFGIMSAGYSGAAHAMLSPEECRLEAEWSLSNPWKSGFRDNFGISPLLLVPYWPDAQRESSHLACFSSYSRYCLGTFKPEGLRGLKYFVFKSASDIEALPYLEFSSAECSAKGGAQRILRAIGGVRNKLVEVPGPREGADLILYVNFPGQKEIPEFIASMDQVAQQGVEFTTMIETRPAMSFGNDLSVDDLASRLQAPAGEVLPVSPGLRHRLNLALDVRKSRSSVHERSRLQLLGADPGAARPGPSVKAVPPARQRSLLANMDGNTRMPGEGFDSLFEAGRLCSLKTADCDIDLGRGLSARVNIDGKVHRFEVSESVSFDTDRSRGLRSMLHLKTPKATLAGKLNIDHMLSDRSNWLIVEAHMRYPWFADKVSVDKFVALSYPLRLTPGADDPWAGLEVRWNSIDGKSQTSRFRGAAQSFMGDEWRFEWTQKGRRIGFALRRLPSETGLAVPLTLVPVRENKSLVQHLLDPKSSHASVVEICFEGESGPLEPAQIRGLNQRMVLAIHPLIDGAELPELSGLVEMEAGPSAIYLEA